MAALTSVNRKNSSVKGVEHKKIAALTALNRIRAALTAFNRKISSVNGVEHKKIAALTALNRK